MAPPCQKKGQESQGPQEAAWNLAPVRQIGSCGIREYHSTQSSMRVELEQSVKAERKDRERDILKEKLAGLSE